MAQPHGEVDLVSHTAEVSQKLRGELHRRQALLTRRGAAFFDLEWLVAPGADLRLRMLRLPALVQVA